MENLHKHQDLWKNKEEIKFKNKLPEWATIDGLKMPPSISLEQSSSEETAKYKVSLANELIEKNEFTDLTGGFGVDCYYIGKHFAKMTYVERNEKLCNLVQHNYSLLGVKNCNIICSNTEDILKDLPLQDLIFIDPARRDDMGRRTYDIKDCTPNVKELNNLLLEKGRKVMIKLSPMLDWHKAVADLNGVAEVHIVAVKNECKELLLILEKGKTLEYVVCVNDGTTLKYNLRELPTPEEKIKLTIEDATYLYEPNAAVMKAGCFRLLAHKFDVNEISNNSHLFVSDNLIPNFPGRIFRIQKMSSLNKNEIKKTLQGIHQANVAVRNFPMTAEDLKKRLKVKDGGNLYIFGTTTQNGKHIIFVCERKIV